MAVTLHRFRLDPEEYEAILIISGLAPYAKFDFQIKATASLLSHCLSSSSHCAAHSSSRRAGWLLCRLSMLRPLVVLLSRCAASCCLVAPADCRIIISYRPLVAPPSLLSSHCAPHDDSKGKQVERRQGDGDGRHNDGGQDDGKMQQGDGLK